jgi:hypothetical protein
MKRSRLMMLHGLMVASCVLVACEGGGPRIDRMLDAITPPTPAEEARNVFNVYDADVRQRAISNLAAAPFGAEEPYVKLYRLMIDDPDPTVRAAATKALGEHGSPEDVPTILIRLRESAAMVRWEAARAFQKLHNPEAVRPLVQTLTRDEDGDVRQAAATALGQYPEPEVFNALVSALHDRLHSVSYAARQSLKTLTGQDFGPDGGKWLAWSEDNTERLFDGKQEYVWQPYQAPPKFLERMQFWKERPPIPPQRPRGIEDQG